MDEPMKPYDPKGQLRKVIGIALDAARKATVSDWMWKANQNSANQVKAREKCKLTFVCQKKARPKYAD